MGWESLPGHLMDLIMHKVQLWYLHGGVDSILQMRLVCKAWSDACMGFAGSTDVMIHKRTDLYELSRLLPSLRSLAVKGMISFYTQPLLALSTLTSLSLVLNFEAGAPLDLPSLPASITALEADGFFVDPLTFKYITCVGITRLALLWTRNVPADIMELLQKLPMLQVGSASMCVDVLLLFWNGFYYFVSSRLRVDILQSFAINVISL